MGVSSVGFIWAVNELWFSVKEEFSCTFWMYCSWCKKGLFIGTFVQGYDYVTERENYSDFPCNPFFFKREHRISNGAHDKVL